jgi:chromosome segregation ATPase
MGHEGFRSNEINFLQQQNHEILSHLEAVDAEREKAQERIKSCEDLDLTLQANNQAIENKVSALSDRHNQHKDEHSSKQEHLKVLNEQNSQLLDALDEEEKKTTKTNQQISKLKEKNRKLQRIAEEFDVAKAQIEKNVSNAKEKCADTVSNMKGQRSLNETLRANIQNTEAKTKVELEALGQALTVVDQKNLEYMQRINKQETKEQQLQSETLALREEVEKLRVDIDKLRKQVEGDDDGRTAFERARGQVESTIQALEVQADTLKKALSSADRANEQLQEENRNSSDRCRETMDKVYALMDSLRLNQVELKKQEAENGARDKKLLSLERQCENLQAKIGMEADARVLAEQERREAEQETSLLRKKNKLVEQAVTQSQQAQEKAEREISEATEKVSQLQTQKAYLESRLDTQEEEKNALKAEIKKKHDRTSQLTGENGKLRDNVDNLTEDIANITSEKENCRKDLEFIKREDVLDEAGRQRPILIQSSESDLVEKLQVNEFLYEAQQARNPVPPLIEKMAQLLAMLHEGQTRADQVLGDLSNSNSLVSAMRQRNVALFNRNQMFDSFKTRALLRYVMNLVEANLASEMYLDGLSFGPREINEMINLLQRYEAQEKVFIISLTDNGLDEDVVNLLLQLIYTLPYLRKIDLKKNCISDAGIKKLEEQLRGMEGVTSVNKSANQVINVHSGNQLRLSVDVSDQVPKEHVSKEIDFSVQQDLSHQDADGFLATDPGSTAQHPWTKAPQSQRSAQVAMPDPSAMELPKPSAAPPAPTIGGPPVGLGGPGNVAALNKKAGKPAKGQDAAKAGDPKKRQARRAKAAPPPALEASVALNSRIIDKWQAANAPSYGASYACPARPRSASRRPSAYAAGGAASPDTERERASSLDRSCSLPTLRRVASRPVYAGARV